MSTTTAPVPATNNTPAPVAPTISEKFVQKVERQFIAEMGTPIAWTPLQKTLAQHLYVKIDAALKEHEQRRASNSYKKDDPTVTWDNLNMTKLAFDATARINVGLDAAIPNHIHVVPYLNKRTGQYDLDLRIGYMGVDHVARNFSIDPPVDIRYRLVHETDVFETGVRGGVEYADYKQTNHFNPGKVIGGYGEIIYDDPRKNRIVIVEYREFEKAKKASGAVEFWGGEQTKWEDRKKVSAGFDEKFEKEMQFKTVVIRVCKKLALDPAKVNAASLSALSEAHMDSILAEAEEVVMENAGTQALPAPAPTAVIEETGEVVEAATAEAAPPGAEGDLGF